jgi:hypothetical protein
MNYHDEIKQVTNGQIITARYLEKLVRVTILRVLGSFIWKKHLEALKHQVSCCSVHSKK